VPLQTSIPRRWRTILVRGGGPILAFAVLVGWAFASPVGSSPDDDFHLASIWCAEGTRADVCGEATSDGARPIDTDVVVTSVCHAYKPETSGACQGSAMTDVGGPTTNVTRGNFAEDLYPPLYYAAAGTLASDHIARSVVAIRIANAALLVCLVTALYWLLPARRRNLALVPIAVTSVPLGLFIVPSTNPSSWAVISAATLWLAIVGYFETEGARAWALGALGVIATLIGAGARSDTAAYAALSIVVATGLVAERTRGFLLRAVLPAVLVVVAALFYLSGSQHGAISTGLLDHTGEAPVGIGENITQTLSRLVHFPSLVLGVFGEWPLGWFDTPLPSIVWMLAVIPALVAVVIGLIRSGRREWLGVVLVSLVMIGGPLVVLAKTRAPVGQYVQPRYILPLVIVIVGLALFRLSTRRFVVPVPVAWTAALALAVSHAIALHATIRRYVTGTDVAGVNLDAGREWWWGGAVGPMAVWILTSIVASLGLAALAAHVSRNAVDEGR